jgi:hypothetical protein
MKTRTLLPIFLILIASTRISPGCALTETGVPACAYFTRADAVFLGKVVKIEDAPKSEDLPEGARKVRFQVQQNFKGADNPTFTLVTSAKTDGGLAIKSGQVWIIYAGNDIVVKSFSVFRGVKIEPKIASEELETLKNVAAGKTETSISGRLSSDPQTGRYGLETVEITVEGKGGKRLTARTDADGAFNLPVPSDGTYKVELKFPFQAGLKWSDDLLNTAFAEGPPTVFKYEVRLTDGDCNFSFFEVSRK